MKFNWILKLQSVVKAKLKPKTRNKLQILRRLFASKTFYVSWMFPIQRYFLWGVWCNNGQLGSSLVDIITGMLQGEGKIEIFVLFVFLMHL